MEKTKLLLTVQFQEPIGKCDWKAVVRKLQFSTIGIKIVSSKNYQRMLNIGEVFDEDQPQ